MLDKVKNIERKYYILKLWIKTKSIVVLEFGFGFDRKFTLLI